MAERTGLRIIRLCPKRREKDGGAPERQESSKPSCDESVRDQKDKDRYAYFEAALLHQSDSSDPGFDLLTCCELDWRQGHYSGQRFESAFDS